MALIKCPECGKEVSDKAQACIHCGCPIQSVKIEQNNISDKKEMFDVEYPVKNGKKKIVIIIASVLLFFVLFIIYYNFFGVPFLLGKGETEAVEILKRRDISYNIEYIHNASKENHTVTHQDLTPFLPIGNKTIEIAIINNDEDYADKSDYNDNQEESKSEKKIMSTNTPAPKRKDLNIGTSYSVSNSYEFTLESLTYGDKITSKNYLDNTGYYQYYEAGNGNVYVDACIKYKNTANSAIEVIDIFQSMKLTYKTYEYNGSIALEKDDRTDFEVSPLFVNINPLTSRYVHILFEIPQYVANEGFDIELILSNGDIYSSGFKVD